MTRPMWFMRLLSRLRATLAVAAVFFGSFAAAAAAPATAPSAFHDQVVSEYLDGRWEQLETDLLATKDPASLSAADRADVDYVRKSMAECRPAWWKVIKAGKKVNFRPLLWGHTVVATYDPSLKNSSVQINFSGSEAHVTVNWEAADMDNTAHAEHGFSKGELTDLGVWLTLGTAQSWADIPIGSQVNLSKDDQLLLTRYLAFRSDVAGAYYCTPRAGRRALWLDLAAWEEKYAKMEAVMSRKAVGAMFAAEVVDHAGRYSSVHLPDKLPDQSAEENLAGEMKSWIEKHGLTLAEDKSLRDALKAFAAANTAKVRQSGKVMLTNGLVVALGPDADKQEQEKRDAWLRDHLAGKTGQ